jgi:hypothetical protein
MFRYLALATCVVLACSALHAENKEQGRLEQVGISSISLWDLTRSDTSTPAWMLHFGVPLGTRPSHQTYFVGEGRLFFDHIDDIRNNYQFWAAVRVRF